jgi:anaerobic magnesium-protoporphyrin IX monomethyl ester cyclase
VRVSLLQEIPYEQQGVLQLAQLLATAGHEPQIHVDYRGGAADHAASHRPRIVGLYATTFQIHWALAAARAVKAVVPEAFVVVGGPHATFSPDHVLTCEAVDAACMGEGEGALLDLCAALDGGSDPSEIQNLAFRNGDGVRRNPLRPLVDDLDGLPIPDRALLYEQLPFLADNPVKPFQVTRGCPYICSFCIHHAYHDLYGGRGRWTRVRSVNSILDELHLIRDRWGLERVFFLDDIFLPVLNRRRLAELMTRYRNEIGLPFKVQLRAEIIDDEVIALLKEGGCTFCEFAVEHGDERLRNERLDKELTDAQIRAAADVLHRHRLPFLTTNIFALPGESLEDAWQTVRLNTEIRPHSVIAFLFQPYDNLKLTREGLEQGHLLADEVRRMDFNSFRNCQTPGPEVDRIKRLHKLFPLLVRFPWLQGLARSAVEWPLGWFYQALFMASFAVGYRSRYDLSLGFIARHWRDILRSYRTIFKS